MQLRLCHNIGHVQGNSNYHKPATIQSANDQGIKLSFDGVYRNVYLHRHLIKPGTVLFVTGSFVGKDNNFDAPMPLEEFCTWDQLMELQGKYGCELGWHTWNHRNLTQLTDSELVAEVKPPFPMRYFAYPYGDCDERTITVVKNLGFEDAYSVSQGNGERFQRKRHYL